jgi:endonuclease/exonuclease/phosphatase family metal-dependent hydrolase
MRIHLKLFIVILCLSTAASANSFSVMTLNTQNLFDTHDDAGKDDKAYLPLEKKQSPDHKKSCNRIKVQSWRNECLFLDWNEETKDAKLTNLVSLITSYNKTGPDILALQEVENIKILEQLFNLLEPFGYIDYKLLESRDRRGIDTAYISKYFLNDTKLHYVKFSSEFSKRKTRPIFEASLNINNQIIKLYNIHFPSNFLPTEMRIESFEALNSLLNQHDYPSIALGDFNLTNIDDKRYQVYANQMNQWDTAHYIGCKSCKGTYYYQPKKSWDFLDTILVAKGRGIEFEKNSIDVFKNEFNLYKNVEKPYRFDSSSKKGVSDHFPMVAKIRLN